MRADATRPPAPPRAPDASDAVFLLRGLGSVPAQRRPAGVRDRRDGVDTPEDRDDRGDREGLDEFADDLAHDCEACAACDADCHDCAECDNDADHDADHDGDPDALGRRILAVAAATVLVVAALVVLLRPADALWCLAAVGAVGLLHPFVVSPTAGVRLTLGCAAAVAVPPLLRFVWTAAAVPQILVEALAHGRYVPPTGELPSLDVHYVPGLGAGTGLLAASAGALLLPTVVWALPRPGRVASAAEAAPRGDDPLFPSDRADPVPAPAVSGEVDLVALTVDTIGEAVELVGGPPAPPVDADPVPAPRRGLRLPSLALPPVAFPRPALPTVSFPRPALPAVRLRRAGLRRPDLTLPAPLLRGSGTAGALLRAPRKAAEELALPQPDRRAVLDRLAEALSQRDVAGGETGLLAMAPQRLDSLTGALGRAAADDVARQALRRLRAWLPPEDHVGRLDPATIAVVVQGLGAPDDALARRITTLLAEPMTVAGRVLSVPFALGIAVSGTELARPHDLVEAAVDALDDALAAPSSPPWAHFDASRRSHRTSEGMLELDLRTALRERAISAAFQPILRLDPDGGPSRPIGIEAFARWTRRDGTDVAPGRFVPLAERLGLGPDLGAAVLDRSLDAVAGWYAAGHPVGRLSVNLAPSQLEDPGLVDVVLALLRRRDLPPSCLVVEVPAAAAHPTPAALRTLEVLTSHGVQALLDDFGATGASVATLTALPLTGVKLDPSLLATPSVLAATVALCRSMSLRCIAEGIETPEHLQVARDAGVDAVQGYLLGRPARARDMTARLAAARSS